MQLSFIALIAVFSSVAIAAPAASTNSGRATFANIDGVTACGINANPNQLTASVSTQFFDSFLGAGSNPNANPICQKSLNVTFQGKTVTARIVDKCIGCGQFDIGLSQAAFSKIANPDVGSVSPVSWLVIN